MEKIKKFYTAENDRQALTIRQMIEIMKQVPEEELDFEVVCCEKMGEELRGIPISNVMLDVDGKQFAIFSFSLRKQLMIDALKAQNAQQAQQTQDTQQNQGQ